jgi:hypothetical protein
LDTLADIVLIQNKKVESGSLGHASRTQVASLRNPRPVKPITKIIVLAIFLTYRNAYRGLAMFSTDCGRLIAPDGRSHDFHCGLCDFLVSFVISCFIQTES